jgi:hypothetical protein
MINFKSIGTFCQIQVAFLRKPEIKFSLDPVDSLAGDWLRLVMITSSLFWLPRDWHGEQVQ